MIRPPDHDELLARCLQLMEKTAGPARTAVYVPGRVEVHGKHTDYAGGRSLVCALQRGFRMALRPRNDGQVRFIPADHPDDGESFTPGERPERPAGHWVHYPAATLERLVRDFGGSAAIGGADVVFLSNIPPAAGMSSSSAFMTAVFLGFVRLFELDRLPVWQEHLSGRPAQAAYLGCMENGRAWGPFGGASGVGTFGGSEDHAAMLCSLPGRLGLFRYDPMQPLAHLPWPEDRVLMVMDSGVAAAKTGAHREAYNRASERARRAVETYNARHGTDYSHLGGLADGECADGPDRVREGLERAERDDPGLAGLRLAARFEQFYREDREWLPAVQAAFETGDLSPLGPVCDASHRAAAEGLENAVPQTDLLQRSARDLGAEAASGFGAGFGGGVWAMVPAEESGDFGVRWLKTYRRGFPTEAGRGHLIFTRPGPPAGEPVLPSGHGRR